MTACPTGVALTYMAAARLGAAARALGHGFRVETQGALGVEDLLTRKEIARADVVILAADVPVRDAERFARSLRLEVSTGDAIAAPEAVFARAEALLRGARGPAATPRNV